MIEGLHRDVRDSVRAMRRRPAFTALAVATLALGIGVNTTSVAVAYGILLRPLPYAESSRVVILNRHFADGGDLGFSPADLREWLPRLRTVDSAAGYYRREVTVRFGDRTIVLPAAFVTQRFFDVLGSPPARGRVLALDGSSEIVLSRRSDVLAESDSPREVVGRAVAVSNTPHVIRGVMASDFAFPDDEISAWLPSRVLDPTTTSEASGYSKILARLKPGVTLDQFRADANRIRLELDPKSRETVSTNVLGESLVGGLRTQLVVALAGALLVLLVACANVATMFIGREVARQRERAARAALGATTRQLVRAIVVEMWLIALLATAAGMVLGTVTLNIFMTQAAGSIAGLHRVALGWPVAVAIAALTIGVTVICAVVPAWHVSRVSAGPLRAEIATAPRAWRARRALVVAQIAMSCVLVIVAGLLARTVSALLHEDHGFRPDGALEAKLVLSDTVLYSGASTRLYVQSLLERVRSMPGVQSAGIGTNLPPRTPPITIATRLVGENRDETRFMKVGTATPEYLRALGVRLIAGRDFEEIDARLESPGVILSESAARFYFPNGDAVGRTIARLPRIFAVPGSPHVVGVVSDIKYEGLDAPASSALYIPWALRPMGTAYLVVRASGDVSLLADDIRATARSIDATVAIPEVQTLDQMLSQSIATRRVRALPALGFGALSLSVAFIGVIATLSTLVAERRRDLAIRAALGASPGRLTWGIVGQGMVLIGIGLAAGLGLGGAAARGLSSLLYGVSPYDATTFAGTVVLVGGGALLLTYAAALGARATDPVTALKAD